jgi:O-antigen ligase
MVRVGFVLIPASILLSKYYTALGRGFGEGGEGFFTGVTTSKNELGGICLLFGLGAAWRMIRFLRNKEERRKFGPVLAQSVLLLMVLWLFYKANTMTALACFTMGCIVLVAASLPWIMRRRWLLHTLILSMLVVAGSALFLGIGSGLLSTMGRDSTLTGRTAVWDVVLPLATNPLIGTGFESFWLGSRLDKIWSVYWWHPNEAHNGYIEVYLNLGWVGLVFFAVLIVTGYRTVVSMLRREPVAASFRLALLVVAIAYNFTESAVRILHPVWICFLMASLAVPGGWIQAGLTKARAVRDAVTPEVFPELELAGGEPNGFELSRLDGPQATPAPSEAGSRSSSFVLYGSKSNPETRD